LLIGGTGRYILIPEIKTPISNGVSISFRLLVEEEGSEK
jgi:hypothetical protein